MPPPPFVGRYEILGPMGSGGVGGFLRASDPRIGGRIVAITLLEEGLDNPEIRRRFILEANAAGVLEHENIVRIFDVGEHEGQPFIAMEFVDGETLAVWIRRREPAPLVRRLRLIEELCDGLAYAHTFGIVHRDITPANLMVEKRRGRLKILGFGISKSAASGITGPETLTRSFNYLSPEQVRGQPVDYRSDIFSVGAVAFELLCYDQAFPGGLVNGVLDRIATHPAPSLSQVLPGIDRDIEQIVSRALEKDPGRRYQDASELHRDLTHVRRRLERDESDEHTMVDRPEEGLDHPPTPAAPAGPPPRPGRSSDTAARLVRPRAEQLEQQLAAAERAFEAGRLEEAIELTYRASAVDEHDPRPHALRERVVGVLDEQQRIQAHEQARAEQEAIRRRQEAAVAERRAPSISRAPLPPGDPDRVTLSVEPVEPSTTLLEKLGLVAAGVIAVPKAAAAWMIDRWRLRGKDAVLQANTWEAPQTGVEPPPEPVLLAASAPREAIPGDAFTARFAVYTETRERAVVTRLAEMAGRVPNTLVRGIPLTRGGHWRRGTPVTVRATADHLLLPKAEQHFEWNGREQILSFPVTVAQVPVPRTTVLCFEVSIADVPVAFVTLDLRIVDRVTDPREADVAGRAPATAFASYATQDREQVALCLSVLHRHDPGLDVFMDCLDLKPNATWQQELERVIPEREAFFLFWSAHAMRSPWVKWELQTVTATRGVGAVLPMPLDDPADAPPPPELAHLNFRDRFLTAREGARARNRDAQRAGGGPDSGHGSTAS